MSNENVSNENESIPVDPFAPDAPEIDENVDAFAQELVAGLVADEIAEDEQESEAEAAVVAEAEEIVSEAEVEEGEIDPLEEFTISMRIAPGDWYVIQKKEK